MKHHPILIITLILTMSLTLTVSHAQIKTHYRLGEIEREYIDTLPEYCDKHGLTYDLYSGESISNYAALSNGWRCDTISGGHSKIVYHNPYNTWSSLGKNNCNNYKTYSYYYYKNGLRYTGKVSDSAKYSNMTQIEFEADCINGMLQGKGKLYYTYYDTHNSKGGLIKCEGNFENGEIVGEWTYFERDGLIDKKYIYEKGKSLPTKLIEYGQDNKVEYIREYNDDHLIISEKRFRQGILIWEKVMIEDNRKNMNTSDYWAVYSYKNYDEKGFLKMAGNKKARTKLSGEIEVGIWYYYNEKGEVIKEEQF